MNSFLWVTLCTFPPRYIQISKDTALVALLSEKSIKYNSKLESKIPGKKLLSMQ